jgi:hypothetical protein
VTNLLLEAQAVLSATTETNSEPSESLPVKLAFVDIDEVLAHGPIKEAEANQVPRIAGDSAFFAVLFRPDLVAQDVPIEGAADELKLLESAGWQIIYISSRPEPTLRQTTEEWLAKHSFPVGKLLILKPTYEPTARYTLQFVKTMHWKTSVIHALALLLKANQVLFIDNDNRTTACVENALRGLVDTGLQLTVKNVLIEEALDDVEYLDPMDIPF